MVGLIALSVAWLMLAARLVVDLLGYKPQGLPGRLIRAGGQGLPVTFIRAGTLVVCSTVLAGQFAATRHWPFSQQDTVDKITLPVAVAGGLCIVLGVLIEVRSQRRRPR